METKTEVSQELPGVQVNQLPPVVYIKSTPLADIIQPVNQIPSSFPTSANVIHSDNQIPPSEVIIQPPPLKQ